MSTSLWQKGGIAAYWICWPALFLYLRNTQRTRVVIVAGNQILLVKTWLGTGQWGLPGGGRHAGETAAVGAVREVSEEVGIALRADRLQLLHEEVQSEHKISVHLTYFLVKLAETAAVRKQTIEISDAAWFTLADLPLSLKTEVKRGMQLAGLA